MEIAAFAIGFMLILWLARRKPPAVVRAIDPEARGAILATMERLERAELRTAADLAAARAEWRRRIAAPELPEYKAVWPNDKTEKPN